jgi:hypothetical protein
LAKCAAITQAGAACKGIPIDASGYCYAHHPDYTDKRRRHGSRAVRGASRAMRHSPSEMEQASSKMSSRSESTPSPLSGWLHILTNVSSARTIRPASPPTPSPPWWRSGPWERCQFVQSRSRSRMATFTTRALMAAALLLRKEFRIRIAMAPVHYRHNSMLAGSPTITASQDSLGFNATQEIPPHRDKAGRMRGVPRPNNSLTALDQHGTF